MADLKVNSASWKDDGRQRGHVAAARHALEIVRHARQAVQQYAQLVIGAIGIAVHADAPLAKLDDGDVGEGDEGAAREARMRAAFDKGEEALRAAVLVELEQQRRADEKNEQCLQQ